MIAISMSTVVHARRGRVWRALIDPSEIIRWDEHILTFEEAAPKGTSEKPVSLLRYQLGSVPVALLDRLVEVERGQRLRHAMSIGAFDFEQTYTLSDEGSTENTRLSLRLASASNSIPVVDGNVDRFDVRRLATEIVDGNLRSIQKWCENHP